MADFGVILHTQADWVSEHALRDIAKGIDVGDADIIYSNLRVQYAIGLLVGLRISEDPETARAITAWVNTNFLHNDESALAAVEHLSRELLGSD